MERAQDGFKTMMKEHIAPALREMGFKGSGHNYTYPDERCHAMLGFQKSEFSDAEDVRFTINVLVVSRQEWEAVALERHYGDRQPRPNTFWGVGWQERISKFIPGCDHDFWWRLDLETDLNDLSAEVLSIVRHGVLPAMVAEIQRQGESPPRR